jgi:hypothetical protein
MGHRPAVAFVVVMAAMVVGVLYGVVLPDIRARAAEDSGTRAVRMQEIDQTSLTQVALVSACEKAIRDMGRSFADVPGVVTQEGDALVVGYVDTAAGNAWSYLCDRTGGSPGIRQIDARRSASNPNGWVRNADGSMSMKSANGRPVTFNGGSVCYADRFEDCAIGRKTP